MQIKFSSLQGSLQLLIELIINLIARSISSQLDREWLPVVYWIKLSIHRFFFSLFYFSFQQVQKTFSIWYLYFQERRFVEVMRIILCSLFWAIFYEAWAKSPANNLTPPHSYFVEVKFHLRSIFYQAPLLNWARNRLRMLRIDSSKSFHSNWRIFLIQKQSHVKAKLGSNLKFPYFDPFQLPLYITLGNILLI